MLHCSHVGNFYIGLLGHCHLSYRVSCDTGHIKTWPVSGRVSGSVGTWEPASEAQIMFLRHNLCWSNTKWPFWGISVTFWGKNAISFGKMLKCISLWYKCLIYGYVSRSDSQMFISEGQVPHFLGTSASYWGISFSFWCASLWAPVSLFEARV